MARKTCVALCHSCISMTIDRFERMVRIVRRRGGSARSCRSVACANLCTPDDLDWVGHRWVDWNPAAPRPRKLIPKRARWINQKARAAECGLVSVLGPVTAEGVKSYIKTVCSHLTQFPALFANAQSEISTHTGPRYGRRQAMRAVDQAQGSAPRAIRWGSRIKVGRLWSKRRQ
jgi:hypothetical protein